MVYQKLAVGPGRLERSSESGEVIGSMFRLIVLDIDGTLLDPSDVVTPVVREAIGQARALGIEVALATGRRLRSTRPIVEELGIALPLVVHNGALVWDTEHDQPLYEASFDRPCLEVAVETAIEHELGLLLIRSPASGERIALPELPGQAATLVEAAVATRPGDVERLSPDELVDLSDVLTVDLFAPEGELRRVTARLAQRGLELFHTGPLTWNANPPFWAANAHMPGTTKASGVAVLAGRLGITLQDVLAIGDGENDLPLLEAAGLGVAMGNAAPQVKARADAVVSGHDEDGVAEAIERFVLRPLRERGLSASLRWSNVGRVERRGSG
jgi:Cof subfamily protein (haloacid dehalogenase superfamily)